MEEEKRGRRTRRGERLVPLTWVPDLAAAAPLDSASG